MDGIGRVALNVSSSLLRRGGHEFVLVYHETWSRTKLEAELGDRRVTWLRTDQPLLSARDVALLPTQLRRAGVDAYYTFNYLSSPFHRGYRAVSMVQDLIPFLYPESVRSSRTGWRFFYATRTPTRAILRAFDTIHVPSANTMGDLSRLFPSVASKIRIVPYAVTPPGDMPDAEVRRELAALGLSPGYVLYVGRFEPYKNVAALVAAHRSLSQAERERHPLVLVGTASPEIERTSVGDPLIHLTGPLPEVEAVYRGALVFAYPSLYEGFGLPPLEAMSRRLPVITTTHASLPEVVGDAAILTDGSEAELGSALAEVIADPERRARLRSASVERAGRFDWDETARLVLDDLVSVSP